MDSTAAPLVVIVEDDSMIARLIATMLGTVGYRTHIAPSAEAAADDLLTLQPALVTLDLNLPGMSGADFLQQLRAEPRTADLPVAIVTAQQEIAPMARALADAVLVKPFGLDELLAVVQATAGPARLIERAVGGSFTTYAS